VAFEREPANAGPEVGGRLQRALERRLDGEPADGREAEPAAALE